MENNKQQQNKKAFKINRDGISIINVLMWISIGFIGLLGVICEFGMLSVNSVLGMIGIAIICLLLCTPQIIVLMLTNMLDGVLFNIESQTELLYKISNKLDN